MAQSGEALERASVEVAELVAEGLGGRELFNARERQNNPPFPAEIRWPGLRRKVRRIPKLVRREVYERELEISRRRAGDVAGGGAEEAR